ncbi:nitrogenase component 1 [Clostridium kluyveri]|uniref:Nitrogenase n=1 Tax=Clostridium kluyveri TaxID=1534 RepID=A0A1L5F4B4_CLOKL|nr:nitrogenase component 1 [Clostridium kluyveri]APM37858.1 nitrogenase [Clostridium kluyveri]UZQ52139.1 nitrogenase [Clostridium kluyveri]
MKMELSTTAPAREERLKAGIAFGGTCANLKYCLNKACLNNANRSFSQTYGCQHGLSLGILNTLRNAVVIMHSPLGCGASTNSSVGQGSNFKRLRDPKAEGTIWLSTNLDESDVISGGEKKLRDTIIYADKEFRPEMIIAVSGCVPALIGDDIDGIISDLQSEVAAALIPVTCEGFKTKVMATAYDAAYNGIMKKLLKNVVREENLVEDDFEEIQRKYLLSRHVNIFNVGSMSRADELELERLLNAIGLAVSFLPCYSAPKDFAYSLENSLNISVCGTHDDYYIKYVEQEYGIPFIIDTIPIGRKNTTRWVLKIAEHFNLEKEAEAFLKKEDELLNESLKPYRKNLKGKRVYLGGGAIRIVATAEVLQDLGMEIVGFKGHHIDKFIEPTFEALENIDDVVFNVATQQPFEQVNIVNKLKPDVIVIHSGINNITAKQGLPILPLFGPTNIYMGYAGVFEIACRLSRKIKNNQFNKNISKNRSLPYKREWYDKEPFTYIRED